MDNIHMCLATLVFGSYSRVTQKEKLGLTGVYSLGYWLLVKVLRPTWHKIGHLETFPKPISWWYGKTKPNTTKAHSHQSKEMYHNTK